MKQMNTDETIEGQEARGKHRSCELVLPKIHKGSSQRVRLKAVRSGLAVSVGSFDLDHRGTNCKRLGIFQEDIVSPVKRSNGREDKCKAQSFNRVCSLGSL